MKKKALIALLLLTLLSHALFASDDLFISSSLREGSEIPLYVTLPESYNENRSYPFIIMLHGHGGNHNEFGGYDYITNALSSVGFVVATLDFPGCGASKESFTLNTMSNMKSDIKDAISYVSSAYSIDKERIGGFGYSMGGRLLLELLSEGYDLFKSIFLTAPAEDTEDLKGLFGGKENWEELKETAFANGYVDYTTIYATLPLSAAWFEDLEANYDGLAEKAKENFSGPVFVLYSENDEAVSPLVSDEVAKIMDAFTLRIPYGGHQYGFYNQDPAVKAATLDSILIWFLSTL